MLRSSAGSILPKYYLIQGRLSLQEGRLQLERLYARYPSSTGQGNVDAEEHELEDEMDQGAVVFGEQTSDTEHDQSEEDSLNEDNEDIVGVVLECIVDVRQIKLTDAYKPLSYRSRSRIVAASKVRLLSYKPRAFTWEFTVLEQR